LDEGLINISGSSITLLAAGGLTATLGEANDKLEVCTSGNFSATADGQHFVFNVCGPLKIKLVQSFLASIDLSGAGSMELASDGSIEAFAGLYLEAGLDIVTLPGSRIFSGGPVTFKAGQQLREGEVGALVKTEGQIDAPSLNVFGSDANDTFVMQHHSPRGRLQLMAGRGHDTIDIAGLLDEVIAYGGDGDDIFLVHSLTNVQLFGDLGNDAMQVKSGQMSLDLTRLEDGLLEGIEVIDIRGTGRHAVTLDHLAVLNLSDETDTLIVRRDGDDQVEIGSGWTFTGHEIIGNELFKVYRQSSAVIKVQSAAGLVMNRHLFYNRSFFDGNSPNVGTSDDAAIATDKAALINGAATLANISNYSRGINGIMIDVFNLPDDVVLTDNDFQFRIGNSDTPAAWAEAPRPSSIVVRRGAGVAGAHRISLVWPDNAIQQQWLQITLLPTANTALEAPDVFYFGNAIGDVGNSPSNVLVNASDIAAIVSNQNSFLNPARITSVYDLNRDRLVNATDVAIAVNHQTSFLNALRLIRIESGPTGRLFGTGRATSVFESTSASTLNTAISSGVLPSTQEPTRRSTQRLDEQSARVSQVGRQATEQVGTPSSLEAYALQVDLLFAADFDNWSEAVEQVNQPQSFTQLTTHPSFPLKSNVRG
ncbi:MAG: hypothetical protein IT423_06505, partial [Pirellulaceae bacterium]|nr:hypothetical protein [Pirellulaceae bacterium]